MAVFMAEEVLKHFELFTLDMNCVDSKGQQGGLASERLR